MGPYLLIFEDGEMNEVEEFSYDWAKSIGNEVLTVLRTDDDCHFQQLDDNNKWRWLERLNET